MPDQEDYRKKNIFRLCDIVWNVLSYFPLVSDKISVGAKVLEWIPVNSIVREALLISKIPNSHMLPSKDKKSARHRGWPLYWRLGHTETTWKILLEWAGSGDGHL